MNGQTEKRPLRLALVGIGHVHAASMVRDFLKFGEDVEFLGFADYPYRSPEEEEHLTMNGFRTENGTVWRYFENYQDLLGEKPDVCILCASAPFWKSPWRSPWRMPRGCTARRKRAART